MNKVLVFKCFSNYINSPTGKKIGKLPKGRALKLSICSLLMNPVHIGRSSGMFNVYHHKKYTNIWCARCAIFNQVMMSVVSKNHPNVPIGHIRDVPAEENFVC